MGIHEEQLGLLHAPLGWEPVEFDDGAKQDLQDLLGDDFPQLLEAARKGDSQGLSDAVEPFYAPDRWGQLPLPTRHVLAYVRPIRIHTDLRMRMDGPPAEEWFGGEVMTPVNQFGSNAFEANMMLHSGELVLPVGTRRGARKACGLGQKKMKKAEPRLFISGPIAWMDITDGGPFVAPPGGSGNDETGWARLTQRCGFRWVAGVQQPEAAEFWFSFWGNEALSGVWLFRKGQGGAELVRPEKQALESPVMADIEMTKRGARKRACPIVKRDDEQRIVIGPVLVPEETDLQGQVISADEIEKAAHDFLARYNRGTRVGLMHRRVQKSIELVESWIERNDVKYSEETVKAGTWMMAHHVVDDEIWAGVQAGTYTGFSVDGVAQIQRLSS
jgi:hypothetical protein